MRGFRVSVLFSEPKIPQYRKARASQITQQVSVLFSEPKIPQSARNPDLAQPRATFQCSSASRKFLNGWGFLFYPRLQCVSVLFSEPKIPQSGRLRRTQCFRRTVSVLFSEPKIPQFRFGVWRRHCVCRFSALQRAENSSILMDVKGSHKLIESFSALQRAENSSISSPTNLNPAT